eukprot:GEZU01016598.1.p1 GENE.GEZU01016598.1~~GEZU01016598.1.p1  ORF type:complete len:233 (+),score=21.50 GEZU01016598.1:410-1108(+)
MKKMDIIAPSIADETDLALFHHKNYIIKLQQVSSKNGKKHTISSHRQRQQQHNKKRSRDSDEEDDTDDDDDDEGSNSDSSSSNYEREDERDYDPRNIEQRKEMEQFGLDDCQPFQGVFDYVCWVAGGSLSAAKLLMPIKLKTKTTTVQHPRRYNIAINWEGGRHHARKYIAFTTSQHVLRVYYFDRLFSFLLSLIQRRSSRVLLRQRHCSCHTRIIEELPPRNVHRYRRPSR